MSVAQPPGRSRTTSDSRSTSVMPGSPQSLPTEGLQPCAATAAYFLFSQGNVILSLHHDTLALDRRFEGHRDQVLFITVDNVSERGAGRLVVSYDASQTAIVWDLFTGNELSRFASFQLIRVAAWMRNGNVAFGNVKGEVILFEPSTSEHISARTIFDPITALAPAADCQTHALGYANGSILIAKLQPTFTILHTLSTSRGPSPIVSLAWHASSSKQKSDMLATQTVDGDLFLWSVSKQLGDPPRVIRSLRRSESNSTEPKWMAWSKNGRLLQYADGETWAWDVRTKHVTYEVIPTVKGLRGLANYGPTATLFTLGPDHTVQQYDVASAVMTASVQHLPQTSSSGPIPIPAAPPTTTSSPAPPSVSHCFVENKERVVSPSPKAMPAEAFTRLDPISSPLSRQSRTESVSSGASSHRHLYRHKSQITRSLYSGTTTTFSTGSPVHTFGDTSLYSGSSFRYGPGTPSVGPRSHRTGSRLRNEVLPSPEEEDFVVDLFPYIRSRLNELPYRPPRRLDDTISTPDEHRKHMLQVVFGWDGDIEGLIRDELCRHAAGTPRAIILSRWLAHIDPNLMMAMAGSVTSSYIDWMLLALSQLGPQTETKKIGRLFVQRLLASGDIHASVAVLLGLGDGSDAVEVYVSRNLYMEAILLACLIMPSEWPRLSFLVRKWGEHVVQNSQQHLALRCFACTDADPPEPWSSPSVQMTSILSDQLKSQPVLSPPLIMAPNNKPLMQPTPPAAKNQSLKLITSFSPHQESQFRFPGLASADMTPVNAPFVTPIDSAQVDTALSPGGSFRMNNSRGIGQNFSSRGGTPTYARRRLPSIGETPTDVLSPIFPVPRPMPTPGDSGSDREKEKGKASVNSEDQTAKSTSRESPELLTSARYNPADDSLKESSMTAFPKDNLASSQPASKSEASDHAQNRKPLDLGIQYTSSDQPQLPATVFKDPFSMARERKVTSPAVEQEAARNATASPGKASARSGTGASANCRNIDEYISGLDEASFYSRKPHGHDHGSDKEISRGRTERRYVEPAKRSPSSPIPMSAEDLALHSGGHTTENASEPGRKVRSGKFRSRSQPKSPRSASGRRTPKSKTDRGWTKSSSRTRSSDRGLAILDTSRQQQGREGFGVRSPSSPVPMEPHDIEDKLRFVTEDRRQRLHSMERSTARRKERSRSAARDTSDRREALRTQAKQDSGDSDAAAAAAATTGEVSSSSLHPPPSGTAGHRYSKSMAEELLMNKSFNQSTGNLSRKEQAAAELEARRLSLLRRPSAPVIPHPEDIQNFQAAYTRSRHYSEEVSPASQDSFSQRIMAKKASPSHSAKSDPNSASVRVPCTVPVGLPSTPRAMRHPKYSFGYAAEQNVPAVPSIPNNPNSLGGGGGNDNPPANPPRAMSAPIPEDVGGLPAHPHFNRQLPSTKVPNVVIPQRRQASPYVQQQQQASTSVNIDNRSGNDANHTPPILPELQHLQTVPPPPPPPQPPHEATDVSPSGSEQRHSFASGSGVGTINIAIDNTSVENTGYGVNNIPQRSETTNSMHNHSGSISMSAGNNNSINSGGHTSDNNARFSVSAPGSSAPTETHRRGRSINENLHSRIRTITERMRSTSRNRGVSRTRSPQNAGADKDGNGNAGGLVEMPYESVKMVAIDKT
ncbi:hypothetical protein VTO42DRAFT_2878 [Malbranchea cinnamomea]